MLQALIISPAVRHSTRFTHATTWPVPDCSLAFALISSAVFSNTSFRRPVMYTLDPLTAKLSEIMRPIPVPPPVTTTILLSTEKRFDRASGEVDVDMLTRMDRSSRSCVGDVEDSNMMHWFIVYRNHSLARSSPVMRPGSLEPTRAEGLLRVAMLRLPASWASEVYMLNRPRCVYGQT